MRVEIKGLKELNQSVSNYGRNIPKYIKKGSKKFMNLLAKKIRSKAPRGSSGYMQSEEGTKVVPLGKGVWGIRMPYYTKFVEKGVKTKYPVSPIRHPKFAMWARMHDKNPFALGRYMSTRGSKKHPFVTRAVHEAIKELQPTMSKEINNAIKISKR